MKKDNIPEVLERRTAQERGTSHKSSMREAPERLPSRTVMDGVNGMAVRLACGEPAEVACGVDKGDEMACEGPP